jgi:transcriptional regulator with XRE-family HTH domain
VALRAGISGSYLNLIEHNRRRIGGKVLLSIAAALEIEPGALAQGAEKRLVTSLRDAAIARPDVEVDLSQLEDFADRFTDWARLNFGPTEPNYCAAPNSQQPIGPSCP